MWGNVPTKVLVEFQRLEITWILSHVKSMLQALPYFFVQIMFMRPL